MAVKVTTNAKQFNRDINKTKKRYSALLQEAMAKTMNTIRIDAAEEELIPNRTGHLSPYKARRDQDSTPGRLTNRTGKLKYMLKHKVSKTSLKNWENIGKRLAKHKSSGLDGLVRMDDKGGATGTWRVNIRPNGRLTSTYRGMPQETKQTLAIRFRWEWSESGLHGQGRRPFIEPAAHKNKHTFHRLMVRKWSELARIERRYNG